MVYLTNKLIGKEVKTMKLALSLIMAVLIGLCFTPAWAQEDSMDASAGLMAQYKWIGGLEFDSVWGFPFIRVFENREIWNIDFQPLPWLENPDLSAAFNLPSGARLLKAKLYAFDGNSGNDVNVKLEIVREFWPNRQSVSLVEMETDTDDLGQGYQAVERTVNHNIRNRDNWYHARVTLDNGDQGLSLRLWGVRLYYKLRVNKNLPTAFTDISHKSDRVQEAVNALAASGITKGCGGTNFCPDANITRGQMAVFLAEALGLYWPADSGF
jgi:hypothetical protein